MIDIVQDIFQARQEYFARHRAWPDYVEMSHEQWLQVRRTIQENGDHRFIFHPPLGEVAGLPVVVSDVVGGPYLVTRTPVKLWAREEAR